MPQNTQRRPLSVPAQVKSVAGQLIAYGRVERPSLGVRLAPDTVARQLGLDGVVLVDVLKGGPADRAGVQGLAAYSDGSIEIRDVVVGLDGKPVRSHRDLLVALDDCKVGQTVRLEVVRVNEGTKRTVTATLTDLDSREL